VLVLQSENNIPTLIGTVVTTTSTINIANDIAISDINVSMSTHPYGGCSCSADPSGTTL
jgi:hypothetical protein